MEKVSVSDHDNLYVISCGDGFSCLGFDVLIRKANAVAAWLRKSGQQASDVPAVLRGTIEAYAVYESLMARGAEFARRTGQRCDAELAPQLVGLEGKRVEVVRADGERQRFQVGKSMGWMPCHLAVARRNCVGGFRVDGPFVSVRVVS